MIQTREELKNYLKENEIKVIALDLDRTTLHSDSTLAPRTRAAIEAAIAAGIQVVVISGRPRCSLPESVLQISGIRYLVTSNGAAINRSDGERVWAWTLCPESVLKILDITFPYYTAEKLTYETFVNGIAYAPEDYVNHPPKYGTPERAIPYVQGTRNPVRDFPEFIKAHAGELDSFDMIIPDFSNFETLKKQLAQNVSDIYMTSSMDRMLEISHRDAGKASGMRYVLGELGVSPAQSMAFGDGDNDADMLAYAGLGVAMANAMPECMANADYITKSNDEYGVAEVIELLLEIRER